MPALNPLRQTSSSVSISTAESSETCSSVDISEPTDEAQAEGPSVDADPFAPVSDEALNSLMRGTVTSSASVPMMTPALTDLAGVETYRLAEGRRLAWEEMLRATELSLRQAEEFRQTLREIEIQRLSTP